MLALYANDRNWLALSHPDVPDTIRAVGTISWEAFSALATAADCGLIVVSAERWDALATRIRALRHSLPLLPIVALAESPVHPAIREAVGAYAVVMTPPLRLVTLRPAIERACTAALLAETVTRIEHHVRDRQSPLRRGLVIAALDREPVTSVSNLAGRVGCHRRTLSARWRTEVRVDRTLSLADALNWILLLRGFLSHAGGRPWSRIATDFGVDRHTLSRVTAALTGIHLRSLTTEAGPQLRSAYRATLLGVFATSGRPSNATSATTRPPA